MQISTSGASLAQAHFASAPAKSAAPAGVHELTDEEQKAVAKLKKIDREVRQHEHAHKAAAGQFATGGPTFEFETGPDGKQYAVGGEVKIDTSKVPDNPEATLRKARTIRQAALAPADPSAQDRKVASEARKMEAEAKREIAKRGREKQADGILTGQQQKPEQPGVDVII